MVYSKQHAEKLRKEIKYLKSSHFINLTREEKLAYINKLNLEKNNTHNKY